MVSLLRDDPSMDGNTKVPTSAVGVADARALRPRLNLCFHHQSSGVQLAFRPDTPGCFDFRRPPKGAPAAPERTVGGMPRLYNPNFDTSDETEAWRLRLNGRRTTTNAMPSRGQFRHAAEDAKLGSEPVAELARGRYVFGGWFIDVMPEQFVCLTLTPMARSEDPNRQSPRQAAVKHAVADASWKPKLALTTAGSVTFSARPAAPGKDKRLLLHAEHAGQTVEREGLRRSESAVSAAPRPYSQQHRSRIAELKRPDPNSSVKYHLWS